MAKIQGTNNNDTLNGTSKDDLIYGKNGNDIINAGAGDDLIDAGAGNDTVNAGDGNDAVDGGDGNDTIDGGAGNDAIDGGDGNDAIKGGAGWDAIYGGDGNDTMTGGSGNDLLVGGRGVDTAVFSGSFADYRILNVFGQIAITGDDGTDVVLETEFLKFDNGTYNVATKAFVPNTPPPAPPTLSISDASANEEAGTITFTVTLSAASSTPVTFNYSTANGTATSGSDYVGVSSLAGTIPANQLSTTITIALTNDQFNQAAIEAGSETFLLNLSNPVGATILDGQAIGAIIEQDALYEDTDGDQSVQGGNGDDIVRGLGGNDGISGGPGNDRLEGGPGFDRALYTNASVGIAVNLAAGTVAVGGSTDTLRSIETVRGSANDDTYNAVGFGTGSTNASSEGNNFNAFEGLDGNDVVTGNGNTRVEYNNAAASVTVDIAAGSGAGTASGDAANVGNDMFTGVNSISGSGFDDFLYGSDNPNNPATVQFDTLETFRGNAGNDYIDGRGGGDIADYSQSTAGIVANLGTGAVSDGLGGTDMLVNIEGIEGSGFNDTIYGGAGKNILRGGGGDDYLDGKDGNDDYTGGDGGDTYAFTTQYAQGNTQTDALHDFASGVDKLAFSTSIYGNAKLPDGSARMIMTGDPLPNAATFIFNPNPPTNSDGFTFNGVLLFDPDGSGSAPPAVIAVFVDSSMDIVASDLTFIEDGAPPAASPTLHISNASAVEGGNMVFHVTIDAPTDHDVTFQAYTDTGTHAISGSDPTIVNFGTATPGNMPGGDYDGFMPTTFTILAGQTSVDIPVHSRVDFVNEGSETMSLRLTNPTGATIQPGVGTGRGVGTIVDDPVTTVSFYADPNDVTEGGDLTFHFHRDLTASSLDVNFVFGPPGISGAATPGVDFTGGTIVHFAAGQADATLVFHTIDDGLAEGEEAFAVQFDFFNNNPHIQFDAAASATAYMAAGGMDPTQVNIGHIVDLV